MFAFTSPTLEAHNRFGSSADSCHVVSNPNKEDEDSSKVVITVFDEQLGQRQYVYKEPWICLVGRAEDCDIQIPSDLNHLQVSRHHCLLEIHPPLVRLRDLGSTNGTFVNGAKIGPRESTDRSTTDYLHSIATELRQGDDVCLGRSPLHLQVEVHADR